jgi:DNA repair exonuclease SbcCD nuclease subunit
MSGTVRFLHTSDWQLGMPANYLNEEARTRFSQARIDAIRTLGDLARKERCEFIVLAGDVFDDNQVARRTVARTMEALAAIKIPLFLLPGNHDCLDAATIYRSRVFREAKPANVQVLEDAKPVSVRYGVEVVGAPWTSKRPLRDLVASACQELQPVAGLLRICIGHGVVDTLSPDPDNPAMIRVASAEKALAEGRIHYLALGDRHSLTKVGESGRIWYSSAPEPTDYDEVEPGQALVIELGAKSCEVQKHEIGTWHYVLRKDIPMDGEPDVQTFRAWLEERADKERTLLKLAFVGTLPLRLKGALDALLEEASSRFAVVQIWDRHNALTVLPDDADFSDLQLSGFARETVTKLRAHAEGGGDQAGVARDALMLLTRLSGGGA